MWEEGLERRTRKEVGRPRRLRLHHQLAPSASRKDDCDDYIRVKQTFLLWALPMLNAHKEGLCMVRGLSRRFRLYRIIRVSGRHLFVTKVLFEWIRSVY